MVGRLMVAAMVRRGAAPPVPVTNGRARTLRLAAGDDMTDGLELDEDAIRAQRMYQQVQTMVRDNPDVAADLVKRWLNRT